MKISEIYITYTYIVPSIIQNDRLFWTLACEYRALFVLIIVMTIVIL